MLGWVEVKVAEDVTTWSCNDSDFKILLTGSVVSSQGQVVEQLPQPLLKFNMMGYGMGSEEFGYNTSDPKVVYPRQGDFDESFKEEDAILRINTAIRWNQSTLRCWLAHLAPSLAPAADLPTLLDCLCALAGVQYLHPFAVTQAKAERDYLVEKERRKEARKARKEALGQGQDRSAKRAKTQCST
jgi:hypothetical protein